MCDVAHTQRARIMVKSTPKKFEAWVDHQNDSEGQGYGKEIGSLATDRHSRALQGHFLGGPPVDLYEYPSEVVSSNDPNDGPGQSHSRLSQLWRTGDDGVHSRCGILL
jgi:hypothetical protein